MKNRLEGIIIDVVEGRNFKYKPTKKDYIYHLRHHSEDWSVPCTIENHVCCNFWGRLVTSKPLRLQQGFIKINKLELKTVLDFIEK